MWTNLRLEKSCLDLPSGAAGTAGSTWLDAQCASSRPPARLPSLQSSTTTWEPLTTTKTVENLEDQYTNAAKLTFAEAQLS